MYKASLKRLSILTLALATLTTFGFKNNAVAQAGVASTPNDTTTSSGTISASSSSQAKVAFIISRGDQEIERRLTTLETLGSKISAATKLTSSDKTALGSEVSTETSGLTALKTQLDADTTLTTARTDAESIFSEYRVYALVVPKVNLIKTADDQQATETKLSALATKLQTRLGSTSSEQSTLSDMTSKIAAAQAISSAMEANVINLQPSDYNSNHSLLSGDAATLKTAAADNQAAITDAKTIIASLKS